MPDFAHILAGRLSAATLGLCAASAVQATVLPSGLSPSLHEVLVEQVDDQRLVRFRFVDAALNPSASEGSLSFETIASDFETLCAKLALPYIAQHELEASQVIIALADRVVEHGRTDPDATQYFEQFRILDGDCIWEAF